MWAQAACRRLKAEAEQERAAVAREAQQLRSDLQIAYAEAAVESMARQDAADLCSQLQGQVEALGAQLEVRPPSRIRRRCSLVECTVLDLGRAWSRCL